MPAILNITLLFKFFSNNDINIFILENISLPLTAGQKFIQSFAMIRKF